MMRETFRKPLTALIGTIQDGRFLKVVFLGLLALSIGTVARDYQEMVANAPQGIPGSQRTEPAPLKLPVPGDQMRPYLPRTMPLGPGRGKPDLPGYFGPLDGEAMASPMKFVRGEDDKASAVGTIDPGAAKRLEVFLAEHDREIGEISLHSPGGSVSDGLAMARMIRKAGISTRVPAHGYCASSCPLVLSGGLHRKAGKNTFIGVHQVYALPNAVGTLHRGMADAQSVAAACQQLLVDMGVDLKVWLKALATPPAQLYVFTDDELLRYNLANGEQPLASPKARPLRPASAAESDSD